MSDRAREGAGGARLRCPFCHDSIAEGPDAIECAECAAMQHASCFAESGECAATGCGSDLVRLNERVVSAHELGFARGAHPLDGLLQAARAAVFLTMVFGLVLAGATAVGGGLGFMVAVVALSTLAAAALYGLFFGPRRRNAREPERERELFQQIGVIIPDPMAPLLAELRRTPAAVPPPPSSAPRPSHCPSCRAALDEESGAATDDDVWSCHHCGASLQPEEPKGA